MSTARFNFWQTTAGVPVQTILQVVRTYYDTPTSQSVSALTDTPITGLSVNITPRSTNSRFFIFGRWYGETSSANPHDHVYYFKRGSAAISVQTTGLGSRPAGMTTVSTNYHETSGWNNDSTPEAVHMFTIDSPATLSQVTYSIACKYQSAGTLYTNRTVSDADNNGNERGTSEIIVMEISI